jgi:hypothetical protein
MPACDFPDCQQPCDPNGFPGFCSLHGQSTGFTELWTSPVCQEIWAPVLTPLYHKESVIDFPISELSQHLQKFIGDKKMSVTELVFLLYSPLAVFGIHNWIRHVGYLMMLQNNMMEYAFTFKAMGEYEKARNEGREMDIPIDVNGTGMCALVIQGYDMLSSVSKDPALKNAFTAYLVESISELIEIGAHVDVQVLPVPNPDWFEATWIPLQKTLMDGIEYEKDGIPWGNIQPILTETIERVRNERQKPENQNKAPVCQDMDTCSKLPVDPKLFKALLPSQAMQAAIQAAAQSGFSGHPSMSMGPGSSPVIEAMAARAYNSHSHAPCRHNRNSQCRKCERAHAGKTPRTRKAKH